MDCKSSRSSTPLPHCFYKIYIARSDSTSKCKFLYWKRLFSFRAHAAQRTEVSEFELIWLFLTLPQEIEIHGSGEGIPHKIFPLCYSDHLGQLDIYSPRIFFKFFCLKILPFHHKYFTSFPSRCSDFLQPLCSSQGILKCEPSSIRFHLMWKHTL